MIPIVLGKGVCKLYNCRGKGTKVQVKIDQKIARGDRIVFNDYAGNCNPYALVKMRYFTTSKYKKVRDRIYMDEVNDIILPESYLKLNAKQKMFFTLFQSVNYYDKTLETYTYLKEDACYLIVYCADQLDELIEVEHEGDNKGYRYKDSKAASYTIQKAKACLKSKRLNEAFNDLTKITLGDDNTIRERTRQRLIDIAFNPNVKPSDSIQALSKLGLWFGLEKPQVVNNTTNVTISKIDDRINEILNGEEELE